MVNRWRRVAAWALCLAVFAACGDDDERDGVQPAPDATTFEQGRFDDLPLLPDSDPLGPRSEKDGVVARSYRTTGATAQGVIDFYEEALHPRGWRVTEPAFREDTESRADWVTDQWRLEVSARRIEDGRNPSSTDVVVQYSLVLRPR